MALRRTHLARVALVALAAVLVVSACADDDDDDAAPTTAASAPSTTGAGPTSGPSATTSPTSSSAATGSTTPGGRTTPTLRQEPLERGTSELDYDVTGTYPQLDGLSGGQATTVNEALEALARDVVADFERDLRDFGEVPSAGDTQSFVEVGPTATLLSPDLASVRLDALTYVAGAAHPAARIITVTFDLRTGRPLALADLFAPGSAFLPRVAERASELLVEQLAAAGPVGEGTPELFPEGVAPTAENYAAWWLTTDGLGVGFAQCQAYACAAGNLEIEVPWGALRDLIAPSGPATALAAA